MAFPDIADSKKCQTLINVAGKASQRMRADLAIIEACRAVFNAASPDTTGTILDGQTAAVASWIDDLTSVLESPVADALIGGIRSGHIEEF